MSSSRSLIQNMRSLISFCLVLLGALTLHSCSSGEGDIKVNGESALEAPSNAAAMATVVGAATPPVYELASVASSPAGSGQMFDFAWNANGQEHWLSEEAAGKVVFINFWGTWCPPCRKEIPDIVEISNENPDVYVIGVAFEKVADPIAAVGKFAAKSNVPYVNVTGGRNLLFKLADAYGAGKSFPTTIVINKEGRIIDQIVGMRSKAEFMTSIHKARRG